MIDANTLSGLVDKRDEKISQTLEKIYSAAQSSAVYGEPVMSGNYTVITACEVTVSGGLGAGLGFGGKPEESKLQEHSGGGGGIGGGGVSSGRPVAIISIGPDGVSVKPVIDVTKIVLAGITVFGSILLLLRRIRQMRKHQR